MLGGFSINKKRILYVVESMGGGVLTYLTQLCNNLNNKYEIIILYGVRNQTPDNLNALFSKNITLVRSKYLKRSISLKNDIKACIELQKNINKYMPDIVHLNSSKAGAVGRIIKFIHFHKYRSIRFFYTPHSYSFLMINSSFFSRSVYYIIEKVLGNLNTKTIACGKSEFIYAKKINSNSIFVNNCVDIEHIELQLKGDYNISNVVYTVGRINEQKNPELFNEVAKKNPSFNFVWIGDGPLKSSLNAENITITGWLSNDEMINKVQTFKYFILCSKWEGLSISLLEAMCMGKICFVTNVSGNKEVIDNGKDGIIFDEIPNFNINDDEGKKISSLAKKRIRENYSLERFIDGYLNAYGLEVKN